MGFIYIDPVVKELESIQDHTPTSDFDDGFNNGVYNALSVIAGQPDVDVESCIYGKWYGVCDREYEDKDSDTVHIISAICSVCRGCAEQVSFIPHTKIEYQRCPHCGAIMKKDYKRFE